MPVTAFQDLPLADRDREWDVEVADVRVRRWARATGAPNERYRDAHLWYDRDRRHTYSAYKLLIADVVHGRLRAVPQAVVAAAGMMHGTRGAADVHHAEIPSEDVDRVKSHLDRYYAKLGESAPWAPEA